MGLGKATEEALMRIAFDALISEGDEVVRIDSVGAGRRPTWWGRCSPGWGFYYAEESSTSGW